MGFLKYDQLPSPGDRYVLGEEIGRGVCGRVVKATDTQANGKVVAIKIQIYDKELREKIDEEYRVYRDFSQYPNFPNLYGVYRKKVAGGSDEVWFVTEYCAGGSVVDLISRLDSQGRRLNEMQIAYIIREVAKGLLEMHKSHIMSRDVKGSNVLLTSEGSVKLIDFGLAKSFESTLGKLGTCIGSPNWMAPEMFTNPSKVNEKSYGSRADVWSLGIMAIELGDGHPPFHEMHPTRMMFQILRNPPPTLYRASNWSQSFNDFIAECLEKNHEHRPYLVEVMEHPFLADLPENDYYISQELKVLNDSVQGVELKSQPEEVAIFKGGLKRYSELPTKLFVEDLCALNSINEAVIIDTLKARQTQGSSFSFAGDVLISLNSNGTIEDYPKAIHQKYMAKTWSDNPPHIFAVADRAHQYMMHHEDPQFIVLSGETYSGKTTQFNQLIKHLCFIGEGNKNADVKVKESVAVIEALINAGTPINRNSTRGVFSANLIFGKTGKLSGAIHSVYMLEKGRITSTDMDQSNFHIFYYFYDAMRANKRLQQFDLEDHRDYRYLRIPSQKPAESKLIRDTPEKNVNKFHDVENALLDLDFEKDQLQSVYSIIAAILLLGEVQYQAGEDSNARATIGNPGVVAKVAKLLNVDEKKFCWALTNYCVIRNGTAERRKHTVDEAREARDSLAAVLYSRLVDWVINIVNQKLSVGRAVFGDYHSITLMDMFGFECYRRNKLDQLFVNCLNEQMQYFYNQRMFVWEMIEQEEEQVPTITDFHFYDNKLAVDQIMSKPYGLLTLMDDSTRSQHDHEQLTHVISTKKMQYVTRAGNHEISIAHYTGKVSYDARDWPEKNRDFVPPELFEALRLSNDPLVKAMSSNPLSKTGNLTLAFESPPQPKHAKGKWTGALVAENNKAKKLNTLSHGLYSQVHKMRTQASVFRSTCLELMKSLSVSASSSGVHFVRCMRINLDNAPNMVQAELVRQQIRAMALVDTTVAGKKGYPYRIPFQEFLRRYKFLAFDFNESVELTKDNCRLLLIRLKMDGWIIGKTKVFLKYYNVEYLSRLYEQQVKKIVKVQAMMRAFLAKRVMGVHIKKQLAKVRQNSAENVQEAEKAALFIQKAYRGYLVRKQYGPLICAKTGKLDSVTAEFIRPYLKRWKVRSIYQVLLQYRAARHMDLVHCMQQVHIFNQIIVHSLTKTSQCVLLDRIDPQQMNAELLGPPKMTVWKLPFRLDEIPYFDTSYLCDPDAAPKISGYDSDDECWDAPLHRRKTVSAKITASANVARHGVGGGRETPNLYIKPFSRDPGHMLMDRRCSSPKPPGDHFNPLKSAGLRPVSERIGELSSNDTYSVYKKRSHAPAPPPPPVEKNHSLKKRQAPRPPKSDFDFDESSFECRSPVKLVASQKSAAFNPAKELKQIVRENSADENEAPFNFQGMLRKTQYNRASMKRNKGQAEGMTPTHRDTPKAKSPINITPQNVVYHSKRQERKERPKSCLAMNNLTVDENHNSLATPLATPRKMSLQQDTLLGDNKIFAVDLINNNDLDEDMFTPETAENYIKEEIAPGIVLEGLVDEV